MKYHYLWLLSLMWGCTSLSPIPTTPIEYYTLSKVAQTQVAPHQSMHALVLTKPTSHAAYRYATMAYLQTPYHLSYFINHRWVAPPSTLILPLLAESLRNTRGFHAVEENYQTVMPKWQLHTHILSMYYDYSEKPTRAKLKLQMTLSDVDKQQVIASMAFEKEQVVKTADPYGGVVAMNEALSLLLTDVVAWVLKHTHHVKSH